HGARVRAPAPGRDLGDHRSTYPRPPRIPTRRRQGDADAGPARPDRRDRPARHQPQPGRQRVPAAVVDRSAPASPFMIGKDAAPPLMIGKDTASPLMTGTTCRKLWPPDGAESTTR